MHSAKNYAVAFLAFTTLAVGVLAWRQHQELIALRAAALDPKERADWQQRLWAAEKSRAELEQQLAAAPAMSQEEANPNAGGPPDAAFPGIEGVRAAGRGSARNRFAALMDQPDMQRMMALQHKAALDGRYADLFKQLGLTPEQLDQFKNLLVEKTTAAMDVLAAARDQGVNPRRDRDTFRQLVAESEADVDASIRSVLGESGFAQYKDFERTQPQRAVVDQLEQRLSYSSTPLTPDQSAQLVKILDATSPASSGSASPGGFLGAALTRAAPVAAFGQQTSISEAAINQSLGVLAAPQIEALRQLQQEQQAQAEMAAAFRNQARGNRASPGGGTGTGSAPTPANPPSGE